MRPRHLDHKIFVPKEEQSALYKRAVQALRRLIKEEGLGFASRAYADATSDKWHKLFEKTSKLKESARRTCLHHFFKKRCWSRSAEVIPCIPNWADHPSVWISGREPEVFVGQPYSIDWQNLQYLVDFCRNHNLEASITCLSWHFPGRTILVTVRKRTNY